MAIPKTLVPAVVAFVTYLVVDRVFPEKIEQNLFADLRGGSKENKESIIKKVAKKVLNDRALKAAIITAFASVGIQHFQKEIEQLLIHEALQHIYFRNVDGNLKVVCDIIQDTDLNLHTQSIKKLIISNDLSQEHKISLLKIKLDYIINGKCSGKSRFMVMVILGLVFTVSGVISLTLILEALYRLFKEGRLGKALYKDILRALARRWETQNVFVEDLLD